MSHPLNQKTFCYVDTEYIRPDHRRAPMNKFTHERINLYSIQYSTLSLRDLKKQSPPKLIVLKREEGEDELSILKPFFPIYKKFFGNIARTDRLIPTGFVVEADLQILANKYIVYQKDILRVRPGLSPKFFNTFHLVQNSRFYDIQWPAQLMIGNMDIRLADIFGNRSVNNKNTKKILIELLSDTITNKRRKQLNGHFDQYIQTEFREFYNAFKLIEQKLQSQPTQRQSAIT